MRNYVSNSMVNLGLRMLSRYTSEGQHILPVNHAEELYANRHSRFIKIDGLNVHYRIEGKGEPLLLLHGFAASLHIWYPWIDLLKNKYQIIRLDLPGFGLTDMPNTRKMDGIDYYGRFINKFVKKIGIEKTHVVGNSLGGMIGWVFAAMYPKKVNKLALICAAGYFDESTKSRTVALVTKPDFRKIIRSGLPRFLIKRMLGNSFGDKNKISRFDIDLYYGIINREGNLLSLMKLASLDINPKPERIKNIQHPTLIMWGSKDKIIKVSNAHLFNNDLQNSQLIIYEDAGHVPQVELPKETSRDLIKFLKS